MGVVVVLHGVRAIAVVNLANQYAAQRLVAGLFQNAGLQAVRHLQVAAGAGVAKDAAHDEFALIAAVDGTRKAAVGDGHFAVDGVARNAGGHFDLLVAQIDGAAVAAALHGRCRLVHLAHDAAYVADAVGGGVHLGVDAEVHAAVAVADGGVVHASHDAAVALGVAGGAEGDVAVDADVLQGGPAGVAEEAAVAALPGDAHVLHLEASAVEGAAELAALVAYGRPVGEGREVDVGREHALGRRVLRRAVGQCAVDELAKPCQLASVAYLIQAAACYVLGRLVAAAHAADAVGAETVCGARCLGFSVIVAKPLALVATGVAVIHFVCVVEHGQIVRAEQLPPGSRGLLAVEQPGHLAAGKLRRGLAARSIGGRGEVVAVGYLTFVYVSIYLARIFAGADYITRRITVAHCACTSAYETTNATYIAGTCSACYAAGVVTV